MSVLRVGLVLLAFSLAACGGRTDVRLTIDAAADVQDVEALELEVFLEQERLPILTRRLPVESGFPTRLRLLPGVQTSGRFVRIHVDAVASGKLTASGGGVVRVPESGRNEVLVTLRAGCKGVLCPGLQTCDAATGSCDGTCRADAACSSLMGCSPDARCEVMEPGSLGQCTGGAADADGDGASASSCPFASQVQSPDCDDRSRQAKPGAERSCGATRDHDCNGVVDELELCSSACTGASSLDGQVTHRLDTGMPVRAIAGARQIEQGWQVFVGSSEAVRAYRITGISEGRRTSSVQVQGLRDVAMSGSLIAAATERGLQLISISGQGELTHVGPPIGMPARDPQPLSSVALSEDTVWVSGQGLGLAAVDVTRPSAPRVLGGRDGPSAVSLVRLRGRILAATTDANRSMILYPAGPRVRPEPGQDVSAQFEVQGHGVTAMAAVPGRMSMQEDEVVALGLKPRQGGGNSRIRLYERIGSQTFEPGADNSQFVTTTGLHLDEGTLLFRTRSGATGLLLRGQGVQFDDSVPAETVPRDNEEEPGGFWGTTDSGGRPVGMAGLGTVIRIATFACGTG